MSSEGCPQRAAVLARFLREKVIGAKARFDPEKCQKEIFAPLPAVFLEDLPAILLVRRLYGGLAGRLTKLSKV
jgi:hypothetical protein